MARVGVAPGDVYGRLTAVCVVGKDKYSNKIWKCTCSCGGNKDVNSMCLRQGLTQSCGCISRERPSHTKHGGRGTSLYKVWKTMRERCNTRSCSCYHNYGGRGIEICTLWNDYSNFREWALSNGYDSNLTIDRINNNGNYEPENCRWATTKQQARNKRNTIYCLDNGISKPLAEIVEEHGVKYRTAWQRIRRGLPPIPASR
jgi:hypothetical protein